MMNFLNYFHQIGDLEYIGLQNCDKAQDLLDQAIEADELGHVEAEVIRGDIKRHRDEIIPGLGNRIRANIRQFAITCKDTSIEAYLQQIEASKREAMNEVENEVEHNR
jgi:hypothetical protein